MIIKRKIIILLTITSLSSFDLTQIVIVSTKEIKVCNETVHMSNGFWYDLMYSEQGNEMFWNAMIFIFSMTGG